MSSGKDANRLEAGRWLDQAERDLAAAESNQQPGFAKHRAAKRLDEVYISSRYPNGLTSGTPGQFYEAKDAEECRALAREIVAFVKTLSAT